MATNGRDTIILSACFPSHVTTAAFASGSPARRADVGDGWQSSTGGRIFACRHCYQLTYPSQREADFQRSQRQADKIRERLGWADDPDLMEGIKPKGMHWRTYHRPVAELEDAEYRSTLGWANFISQKFGNLSDL